MKRFFQIIGVLVGIWLLASFLGVILTGLLFDSANAHVWTRSLMWSLLSLMVLAPVFLFVGTSPSSSTESDTSDESARPEQDFGVDDNPAVHETTPPEGERSAQ